MYTCVYLKGNRLWVNVKCLTYLTVDPLGSHVKKYNTVYCLCMILRRINDFFVAILQKLASAACISRGGQIEPFFVKPNLDGWFLMPFFLLDTNPMRSRVYCMPIRWFSGLFQNDCQKSLILAAILTFLLSECIMGDEKMISYLKINALIISS